MLSRTDLGQVYGSVNRDLSFDDTIGDEDNPNKSDDEDPRVQDDKGSVASPLRS